MCDLACLGPQPGQCVLACAGGVVGPPLGLAQRSVGEVHALGLIVRTGGVPNMQPHNRRAHTLTLCVCATQPLSSSIVFTLVDCTVCRPLVRYVRSWHAPLPIGRHEMMPLLYDALQSPMFEGHGCDSVRCQVSGTVFSRHCPRSETKPLRVALGCQDVKTARARSFLLKGIRWCGATVAPGWRRLR